MNNLVTNNSKRIRVLCISALLVALSFILANVKLFSTIALDSMPAFLGAMVISPLMGAIIGVLGHFFTALTSGFPLSLPIHKVVMMEMLIIVYLYGKIYNKGNGILAAILAMILNGPVSTYIVAIVNNLITKAPVNGFFFAMVVPLTIASGVNIFLAYVLGRILKNANIKI